VKAFYHLLGNSLIATVTNFFVWASVIYWGYLETGSVLATSIISGVYLACVAGSGFWFGSIVDHNRKKTAMLISSVATLVLFSIALVLFAASPAGAFKTVASPRLWLIAVILLLGVIAGNIRNIALPTAVTFLVPEDRRDRANGMSGTVMGISFAVSNVAAGFGLGLFGMFWVLATAIALTLIAIVHLLCIRIPEPEAPLAAVDAPPEKKRIDLKGTLAVVRSIPGLLPLIFFTTFNNFLGGVFMALMDAYGLTLVSVQFWGTLWGFLSLGFIVGGLYISKRGLGPNPVKRIFSINLILWTLCVVMALKASIVLLGICLFGYLCLMPFIEACEQTVIQKVVPRERQGRVFGFAQSIEQAASPVTAFLIGPLAQFVFIPFMTTGAGVELIGGWYGVGVGRGIGLVFTLAGIIGLAVTLVARNSRSAKTLSARYQAEPMTTPASSSSASEPIPESAGSSAPS
jgi:MFS transporter, DHA3 family, multidrug efflux protein